MTLETYTVEQLQAEIDRRKAVNDEARLLFADVLEIYGTAPTIVEAIRDKELERDDRRAIAVLAKKLADVRAEKVDTAEPRSIPSAYFHKIIEDRRAETARLRAIGEARENAQPGWIEWKGGECPVADGVFVECLIQIGPKNASLLRWSHFGDSGNIIAYRVVTLEEHPLF